MPGLLANIWNEFGTRRSAAVRSHGSATLMRRGPVLSLILCGGLLVTAIIVGTAMMVGEFRERALSNREREFENTVLLLSRHFDQQFEDAGIIASNLISVMKLSDFTSPEMFNSRVSGPGPHLVLKSRAGALSYVADVRIFDSEGELINSSAVWPPPAVNIADRTFFKTLKSDPGATVMLSEAMRGYSTGSLATVLAHRLSAPDGTFLGVMARRIDPLHFQEFLATIALGEGAAISMFHRDGTMLARYPDVNSMIGQKFRGAPLLNKILTEGGHQTLRLESPVDGMPRLGAAAALTRVPIVVVATATVAAALSDWRAQARLIVAAAVLSALVIALVLYLIVRQLARQGRESQQRLELQKQQLDTALNNMTQGLVLYDASARIILCNRRYIDMYKLSTDVVKPGCHFYDLIRHRQQTGSFDGDVEEFCSSIMRNIRQGKVTHMTSEAAGRWYEIVNTPLAQGGWVATIEDITGRRNLEQERDRNYAFLRQIIDHIPSQITVKDARNCRYLLANRVAEAQFGLSRDAIVGKTAADIFPEAAAKIITADDNATLESADGLYLGEHQWNSQGMGQRFITSRRIGIRDQTGETRYLINVVDDVTDRRRADEKIARLAHYDALTDLPNRVLFREQIERELLKTGQDGQFSPCCISTSTSSKASTICSDTMSAMNC